MDQDAVECVLQNAPKCSRDGRDARWQMADGKQGTPASDLNGGLVGAHGGVDKVGRNNEDNHCLLGLL